ncbi:uncharacterized protein LOC34618314 [Cyclospora cayetanensis]|nr:uncharacterized protein LOC34618314 [Cyclospora cayetanensis]
MLFAFLETQEDFSGAAQALSTFPSICKTQGLDQPKQAMSTSPEINCNLTGVDPECFLINISGQVGKSWGTQEADEQKAAQMIQKLLKGQELVLHAAITACAAAPLAVPLLSQFGTELPSAAEVINEAAAACRS